MPFGRKKASKNYCPNTENHRHKMTSHKNTDLSKDDHAGGIQHGVTHITYCRECGYTDHRR